MTNIDAGETYRPWMLQSLPDMDDGLFRQWQLLVESRTGMMLPPERKTFLQTNLGIRMREIGCPNYQEYYDKVVQGPAGVREWTILVDRLTVQETRFQRDPQALALLRDYLLGRGWTREASVEAWSVGCATGEEAYTLAMVIDECLEQLGRRKLFGVTGTDLSQPALNKARKGVYPERKLATLDEERRNRYFTRRADGQYEVVPMLRERVCFARVNVLELRNAPMRHMDIIYCQNLLIYFRRWRRKEILNQLAERLAPGGLMILGLGEVVDWQHPLLARVPNDEALAYIRRTE